jgi:uncharacterized membrane protein YvbJ
MTGLLHERHEIHRLVDHAIDNLKITEDELYIAIARLTENREYEIKRLRMLDDERKSKG